LVQSLLTEQEPRNFKMHAAANRGGPAPKWSARTGPMKHITVSKDHPVVRKRVSYTSSLLPTSTSICKSAPFQNIPRLHPLSCPWAVWIGFRVSAYHVDPFVAYYLSPPRGAFDPERAWALCRPACTFITGARETDSETPRLSDLHRSSRSGRVTRPTAPRCGERPRCPVLPKSHSHAPASSSGAPRRTRDPFLKQEPLPCTPPSGPPKMHTRACHVPPITAPSRIYLPQPPHAPRPPPPPLLPSPAPDQSHRATCATTKRSVTPATSKPTPGSCDRRTLPPAKADTQPGHRPKPGSRHCGKGLRGRCERKAR